MISTRLKPLALAIVTTGLLSTITGPALSAPGIRQQLTYRPGRTVTAQEETAMSAAAARVLRHIAQARADIHQKDVAAAKAQLEKANTLLTMIETSLPTTKVKDRIWVAKKHLEYEDSEEVLPDLVPIYASLDEMIDILPVDDSRAHVDKAKEHMEKGEKKPALKELDAADAALIYTEIDLPLSSTRNLIAGALADLAKERTEQADKQLKVAEDNVVFLSLDVAEPLVPAKSAFWDAVRHYESGSYATAKADVGRAIGYLQHAVQSTDAVAKHDAKQLLAQAQELESELDHASDESRAKLEQLWQRTDALAQRATEYVSTGWERLRPSDSVRENLIEAKLHLAYSRIEQFTDDNTDRANNELKQVVKQLDQAVERVNEAPIYEGLKENLDKLKTNAQQLENERAGARTQTQYAAINMEMRHLIRVL